MGVFEFFLVMILSIFGEDFELKVNKISESFTSVFRDIKPFLGTECFLDGEK